MSNMNHACFDNAAGVVALSWDEIDAVGGAINWGRVGNQAAGGAISGAIGGAAGGAVAGAMAGGVGAAPGAVAGGVAGAVAGAVGGAVMEIWNQATS